MLRPILLLALHPAVVNSLAAGAPEQLLFLISASVALLVLHLNYTLEILE
jgi:hypothetical protein